MTLALIPSGYCRGDDFAVPEGLDDLDALLRIARAGRSNPGPDSPFTQERDRICRPITGVPRVTRSLRAARAASSLSPMNRRTNFGV